ncbi:MAG: class I SAM-dependent methyltransferase [Acidobacteriota bacterium]
MKSEPEYISVNRIAYDRLAPEYRARAEADRIRDQKLVAPFATYLLDRFGATARILDIGPGNGINLAMFAEYGFTVNGIDISKRMLNLARRFAPTADLRYGNFLVAEYPEGSFEGVFAKASIHLFPKKDAELAIRKVAHLLVRSGIFYVTTTLGQRSREGFAQKDDYAGETVRYRKIWTPSELRSIVEAAGFRIWKESVNDEPERNKRWFNIWAIKS